MKKWLKIVLVLLALAAVGVAARLTLFAPTTVAVEVFQPELGRVESTITNSRAGTVEARHRAKLSPEYGGQVVEIPFREGDRVERGEILLRLEDSLQRARLELAQRDLEALKSERVRACLEAERAAREFYRNKRLAEEEIVSAEILDNIDSLRQTAAAACTAAAANVSRAEAAVRLAGTELEKTLLRAPFDGIVAEVSTEVGEWTTPSPPALPVPPVIDVLDPSSIYISAPVDEVDAARIRSGLPARVTVDSHRDRHFDGTVSRVAPYVLDIEAQNRTVEIEVELDEHDEVLLPGTSADVEVILEVREDVLRVPTATLLEGARLLLVEDGFLVAREVTTGLRNWDFTEITGGLESSDLVVTTLDRTEVVAGARAEVVGDREE